MATPVFCCGAECGILATNGHFQDEGGTLPTIETTTIRTGLRAFRAAASANTSYVITATGIDALGTADGVGRVYVRFVSLPTADCPIIGKGSTSAGPNITFKQSDSKLYCGVGTTLGASGVSVTTGVWYRIDFHFFSSATVADTSDAEVDGVALGQASLTVGALNTNLWLGLINSNTADIIFDDVLVSNTAADYPLGAGYVKSYIPDADGTHNVAGANDFERSLTGTDILNSTTDAFELVNDRPLPTTEVDFINAKAPPNTTDYVEVAYENSSESAAPRAVEAIAVVHDAGGAGTCAYQLTLRDTNGGTTADIFNSTQNVGATITYRRAHFATIPGTASAWTLTAFNALVTRFIVSDPAPDVYLDALMLEAEYSDSGVSASISGEPATATAAGVVPTVTAVRIAAITGEPATASSSAVEATIQIARSVTGEVASASAAAIEAVITTVRIVSVAGEPATATANAVEGVITAARILSVAGEPATATANAVEGVITAQLQVSIAGEPATASANAVEAVVTAQRIVSIAGEPATASAHAIEAVIDTGSPVDANIAGEPAVATANAIAGAVEIARSIPGEAATATANAIEAVVTAVRIVSISGEPATASAHAIEAVIATGGTVAISGEPATATASAVEAVITAVRTTSIAGEPATAGANAVEAVITAGIAISVSGEPATASAEAIAAVVTAARTVSIAGEAATATAAAVEGDIQTEVPGDVLIAGAVATAQAEVIPGFWELVIMTAILLALDEETTIRFALDEASIIRIGKDEEAAVLSGMF